MSARSAPRPQLLTASGLTPQHLTPAVDNEGVTRRGGRPYEDIEDFFENAASALHWVDSRGIILRANKYELDTLRYEHDEYVGHHITEFHADQEIITDILGRLGRNETLRDYEGSLRAKDGSIRHVVINSNVRWSEDGEFLHTRCFTQDVTDRKLAQQALAETMADLERKVAERTSELESANRELERHREQLVEAQRIGQFGSWDWDVASSDVSWSQELHQIFGLAEDVVPTHAAFLALIHPEDKEVRLAALERGLRSEEPFAYEVRIIRPGGDLRFLDVRASTTFGPDGDPVRLAGTAQDVTESKLAAEERQLFEARWQEAQRLESLGVLAGGIAHDFNNLLVGVLGNASLALADLPPDSPARTRIEGVELAARRAGELTQQLLAYSGQGSFVVQPLDLVEVVGEMGHLLETVVSKKVRLDYEFGVKRPVVEIDATQFRQVVMNSAGVSGKPKLPPGRPPASGPGDAVPRQSTIGTSRNPSLTTSRAGSSPRSSRPSALLWSSVMSCAGSSGCSPKPVPCTPVSSICSSPPASAWCCRRRRSPTHTSLGRSRSSGAKGSHGGQPSDASRRSFGRTRSPTLGRSMSPSSTKTGFSRCCAFPSWGGTRS